MPLTRARRELVAAQEDVATLRAANLHLQLEVRRLEHALTTAEILTATLSTPKVIVLDLAKDLTPRETEVLIRLMAGDTTGQVGRRLFMSSSTVKSHVARIYHKLHVHNRGAAVMAGVHMGLDQPKEDHR